MAAPQAHWRLGVFIVAGAALALATVVVLAARSMQRDVGIYVSYFDESVQGLEVGSPIKFRGVTVGTVGKIRVAPDHRHVEVESNLGLEELTRLGLDIAKGPAIAGTPKKLEMSADLRIQLASAGLTEVKFLQLDFFDLAGHPLPELPFPVPPNYIPAAPSMMKNLGDSVTIIMNRLPEVIEETASILREIREIVRAADQSHIPERVVTTLDGLDALLATANGKLEDADVAELSANASRALLAAGSASARLDALLARLDREEGLLTSVERASHAVGDALRDGDGLGGQLLETLKQLQSSARSVRKLTEALERDPDMLLKGRSPEVEK